MIELTFREEIKHFSDIVKSIEKFELGINSNRKIHFEKYGI